MEMNSIRPLDLIFFCGSEVISSLIRMAEERQCRNKYLCGRWPTDCLNRDCGSIIPSHVGLVVSRELLPAVTCMRPGCLYLLESTIDVASITACSEIIDGSTNGVQLRELQDAIDSYCMEPRSRWDKCCSYLRCCPPKVWHAPLLNNPYRDKHVRRSLTKLYENMIEKSYEFSFIPQLASTFDCLRPCANWILESRNNIYCSELVTLFYEHAGVAHWDDVCVSPIDILYARHCHEYVLGDLVQLPTNLYIS